MGYSSWGRRESDTTKRLTLSLLHFQQKSVHLRKNMEIFVQAKFEDFIKPERASQKALRIVLHIRNQGTGI